VLDGVATELFGFAGAVPPASLVTAAVRHWAATGGWSVIAGLPAAAITPATLTERIRSTLLTAGLTAALSDLESLTAGPGDELGAALRAELLAFAGLPDQAVTALRPARLAGVPDRPALVADDAARSAWQQGRWTDLLALAEHDRLTGRQAHALSTAEESAAFAADVWIHRGRPEFARRWLTEAAAAPDEPAPRPLTEWSLAGLDLMLDRGEAAVERLSGALAWMRAARSERHLDLLLERQVFVLSNVGRLAEAGETLAELTELAERDPAVTVRARHAAVVLAGLGGPAVPAELPEQYLDLAQRLGLPFELAIARLTVGTHRQDAEQVQAAVAGFGELGATMWEVRAAGRANRLGVDAQRTSRPAVDELIGDLVAGGLSNAAIGKLLLRNEMYAKRQVSRLLRATNTRHRAQLTAQAQRPAAVEPPDRPADPARRLADSTEPVLQLLGPPGSGRTTVLGRVRKALAETGLVLLVNGRAAAGEPAGLAGAVRALLPGPVDAELRPETLVTAVRSLARSRPVTLLLDNADTLDPASRALLRTLAAGAGSGLRVVLAGVRPDPALSDLAGPPVRLGPLTAADIGAALSQRFTEEPDPATVAAVTRRTAGNRAALDALLRLPRTDDPYPALRTGLLDPDTAPLVRELRSGDPDLRRCATLLAALAGARVPEVEPALAQVGLTAPVVRATIRRLVGLGLLSVGPDGWLTFTVPLLGDTLAAAADWADRRAVHGALARRMLTERAAGHPVEWERLAEHLVGAGAEFGQPELVEAAERMLPHDPKRALRWSSALLAAEPATTLEARAATTAAGALYELSRYQEAAAAARRAIDALPEVDGGDDRDSLGARTVLVNSLIRTGQHDIALDVATNGTDAPRSVPDGLQVARLQLMRQRFDKALSALAELRPTNRDQRIARLAGVRVLAAIGAEGDPWRAAEEQAEEAIAPLSAAQLEIARRALAWGDLYTAERGIMSGAHPAPAARRNPPPSMARLTAGIDALRTGAWDEVLELADEQVEQGDPPTHADGLLAALAAEVLAQRGRPGEARARLAGFGVEQPFGHVIGWAQAGIEIVDGHPERAADQLCEMDRRCRRLGYLTGRELVLSRQVDAELAMDNRPAAATTVQLLAEVSPRINTRQAALHLLLVRLLVTAEERAARAGVQLAEDCGEKFLAARVRLAGAEGAGDPESAEATESLRAAHTTFRELGAGRWQRRCAELMRARGMSSRTAQTIGEQDRKLIELIAAGSTNAEAAANLQVTEKAIEARLTRLYRRTGLRSRVELVREYGPSGS
jgi:DNA-binding NarL/FixJ family response regulator/tetratricopeptide (TPR) repeat protein